MSRDTGVVASRQPEASDDPLSELAGEGARRMLAQMLIAEADSFVAMWKDLKLPDGRDRVVRHGHGPHRTIQTGVGPVEVRRAKVRDRGDVDVEEKIRFSSSILPKWARRTKSLDALLPVLYLRGVSRSEEHTSELQSQSNLVCRLLLEKKNQTSAFSDRLMKRTTGPTQIPPAGHRPFQSSRDPTHSTRPRRPSSPARAYVFAL